MSERIRAACQYSGIVQNLCEPSECANCSNFDTAWKSLMGQLRYKNAGA